MVIVEQGSKGEETWVVRPSPGYVLKFKDVKQKVGLIRETSDDANQKVFINVCHCNELPNVMNDLDEEDCAKALSEDPDSYKIPISIGNVEISVDNHGETCQKIDLIVNSTFYYKRLDVSEFYRQFLLMTVVEAIEAKHGIKLDLTKAVRLRNRKVVGEITTQNIRKRPTASHVVDVNPGTSDGVEEMKPEDETDLDAAKGPRNYKIDVIDEESIVIKIRVPDIEPPVLDKSRLTLKMNEDRVLLLLDKRSTIADLHLCVRMELENVKSKFEPSLRTMIIEVPLAI